MTEGTGYDPPAGGVTWSVGPQRPTTVPSPQGPPITGVDVTVNLSNGDIFTVFIPSDAYRNIEAVRAAINEAVAHRLAISGLTG